MAIHNAHDSCTTAPNATAPWCARLGAILKWRPSRCREPTEAGSADNTVVTMAVELHGPKLATQLGDR